jgi:glucose/arabinose dehydrogenase
MKTPVKIFTLTLLSLFSIQIILAATPLKLVPRRVTLANGKSFNLNLPEGFEIKVAAQGLKRVRFMTKSPDNRIFVTDMYDLSDNRRGAVYILDEFDSSIGRFKRVIPYMTGLRNPNNVAFYTDRTGTHWFYLPLTDRLLRYRYEPGSTKPTGQPEVLATFPDYGLSYKYGGWHLTRTVVVASNGKVYVSVGSSCNACVEKEEVRATVVEMDPDGKNQRYYARGLRNAVGMRFYEGELFVTNMGADHLGLDRPADTMGPIKDGTNYGWPFCYQSGSKIYDDPKMNPRGDKLDCRRVPALEVALPAHGAPLGLEYFNDSHGSELRGSFLVALHGSTNKRIARGYRVLRLPTPGSKPDDFITGFLDRGIVNGRPADIFGMGTDAFLLTDDRAGVVYYIFKPKK